MDSKPPAAWMDLLMEADRNHALYLGTSPDPRHQRLADDYEALATDPGYQQVRQVRAGGHTLEEKSIELPELPSGNDRPKPDWFPQNDVDWRILHSSLQETRIFDWTVTARAFEKEPNDLYNAWHYLNNHPAFWYFHGPDVEMHERNLIDDQGTAVLDMSAHLVSPLTGHVEKDASQNTVTEVWVELGKRGWPTLVTGDVEPGTLYHDPDLDCGGATMDEAVITAAVMVHTYYGNDRRICDAEKADAPTA